MSELRGRITVAAQELFAVEGVEGISMRRLAERVGVTATALYRHFRDKDAILDALISAGLAVLSDYLEPALRAKDPERRLRGLIDAYLKFALEQPKYFDLAFMVPSASTRMSEELERHNRATFKMAIEQVAACMQTGVFRPGDPIETAVYIWSTAHGLVTLHRMNRFGGDAAQFERFYHGAIEQALQGLRPAPAASPTPPAPGSRRQAAPPRGARPDRDASLRDDA
jgi:AcrR family transcriptional regulator